jgi:replication-associated recombination protein RarA
LQKAIRRGRVDYAVAAADSLVVLEPDYVASRLPVIAYEDIGVADLPTLLCLRGLVLRWLKLFVGPETKPTGNLRPIL